MSTNNTSRAPLVRLAEKVRGFSPYQLAVMRERITADDLDVIERAIGEHAQLGWRASPMSLGVHLRLGNPPMIAMPHTKYLSDKFLDALEGRSSFQIWNVPARHGKSLLASIVGPVYALDRIPTLRLALTSYGGALAHENSVQVRNILQEKRSLLRVQLRPDAQAAGRFVTDEGGGLIAAGVGGPLTGFGAHGLIIDDPHKDWQEAHSETLREHVWNWYRSVARTRLMDNRPDGVPAFVIVVMTRWHEDDLTGRLIEAMKTEPDGDKWELVRLPALAESVGLGNEPFTDPLGRADGEPLAPMLYTKEAMTRRALVLGSYLAAGMEQQRPSPAEGGEIKRAWWRWTQNMPKEHDLWISSWDMKLKDKETGDYVVGQVWGRTGSAFFGHDQLRGQFSMLKTAAAIALLSVRWPMVKKHYVENSGNGPEVMQILRGGDQNARVQKTMADELGMTPDERQAVGDLFRRGLPGIVPVTPKGSKVARARAVTAFLEAGNVWLPEGHDWAMSLVNECAAFPQGAHDDQVDTWSQAMSALSGRIRVGVAPQVGESPSNWK